MIDPAEADMLVAMFGDAVSPALADRRSLLREWSARYPDLQADFAAVVVEMQSVASPGAGEAAEIALQARLSDDIMTQLRPAVSMGDMRGGAQAATMGAAGPAGLQAASVAAGVGFPDDLAARLRLPAGLVNRLALGKIDPITVPMVLVRQISETLQAGQEQVIAWLSGPASFSQPAVAMVRETAAPYRALAGFADVVSASDELSDDDRTYWTSVLAVSRSIGDNDAGAR